MFIFTKGKTPELFYANYLMDQCTKFTFLVEGETDAMKLQQEIGPKSDVFGLSGIEAWQPHFADRFSGAEKVYIVLDNDTDYSVKTRVDNAWRQIRGDLGRKASRVYLPAGCKDICEFFQTYDLELFKELVNRQAPLEHRLARLDLSKAPPPMDWMVEGLICSGDVNLMVGDPGLGKSWLTMDLAVKIAQGSGLWLGHQVQKGGRVMYVDEENPEDIIYYRFYQLGLTEQEADKIDFLYRPGIWLNKDPETLLYEAYDVEPTLIVLDSLSRLHSEDENNNNAMAALFRDAITPLARETGAAVVVIHHTIKSEEANSFRRARGAGDLTAVVDAALDCRPTQDINRLTVSQYKSRRRAGGEIITVTRRDTEGGHVELRAASSDDLPF